MPLDKTLQRLEAEMLKSRNLYRFVKKLIEEGQLDRETLKALLSNNHNLIDPETARSLLNEGFISEDDLLECDIDSQYIDLLFEEEPIDPADGSDFRAIETIAPGATEVFFWGMPASGKSCALGAVMSIANNNGSDIMKQHPCQGGDYMSRLSQVFGSEGTYTFLPAGTAIQNTYEMRFSIIRDQKEHPLALIDLSGELFRCLYKQYTNIVLNEDEKAAFSILNNILVEHASANRKIHFFVIEYGAESQMVDGLKQDKYLQRAADYLDRLGVFDEYTDAIYIILTKADKAGEFDSREREIEHFQNYMSKNYNGFYWALQDMCEKHSINGGILEFVPFSIGDVCMRRLCHFDSTSAREILDYIVERSFYVERNFLGQVVRYLRN